MRGEDAATGQAGASDGYVRVVEAIYAASAGENGWKDAIDAICSVFPGGHGTLLFHDLAYGRSAYVRTTGWNEASFEAHALETGWHKTPDQARELGAAIPTDGREPARIALFSGRLKTEEPLSGIRLTIGQNKDRYVVVSVFYPEITAMVAHRNILLMQRLATHLELAFEINRRLEMSAIRSSAAEESLHMLRTGLILVADDGQVVFSNRAADAILRRSDGLCLNQRGQVTASSPPVNTRLRAVIKNMAVPDRTQRWQAGNIIVERPSGDSAFSLLLAPIRNVFPEAVSAQPTAVILICQRDAAAPPELLSEALGITQAEGRVLNQLLSGCTIPDCGSRMQISRHTARAHLRHIFDKLGVSSQGQLMKYVAEHPISMFRFG
jgi:DNA-binding CsgD family transcriptional regulator